MNLGIGVKGRDGDGVGGLGSDLRHIELGEARWSILLRERRKMGNWGRG